MDNLPYGCYVLFDKDANKLFSEARDFAGMRVDYCCIKVTFFINSFRKYVFTPLFNGRLLYVPPRRSLRFYLV